MEETLIKRVLPNSPEAEQSVIGSMMMDSEAIMTASEILTSEDFYQRQYGILFDAMVELYNEGKAVDLVTLQDRLKEKDVPPEVASLEFVKDILDSVYTSAHIRSPSRYDCAPVGMIINSCISIVLSACLPPFMIFIIGTGIFLALVPPR